jgi:hypothetical protein
MKDCSGVILDIDRSRATKRLTRSGDGQYE